jgi:hypothetical protein
MTTKLLSTLAVLAALVVAVPATASAAEPVHSPAPVASSNGIIAILIGQFTPPIGSNKGSVVDPRP